MDYRRWSYWAEWTLVAIVIGLHAVVFFWREDLSKPSFVLTAAHDAQLLSGIVLVIGWVVLGPGLLWIRLLAAPILAVLWFTPWNAAMQPREMTAGFIGTFFCAVAVVICGVRACGFSISRREAADGPERAAQFSLLSLIISMTAIAATIGVLEALRPTLNASSSYNGYVSFLQPAPLPQQARLLVMAASVALAAVGGLWVVLRRGGIWLRLAALPAAIAALAFYLAQLASGGQGEIKSTAISLATAFASTAAVCGVSVLPLRFFVYRLQRGPKRMPPNGWKTRDIQQIAERAIAAGIIVGICVVGYRQVRTDSQAVSFTINGGWEWKANVTNSTFFFRSDNALWSGTARQVTTNITPPLHAVDGWVRHRSVGPFDQLVWMISNTVQPVSGGSWSFNVIVNEGSTSSILLGADGAVRIEAAGEEKSDDTSDKQP